MGVPLAGDLRGQVTNAAVQCPAVSLPNSVVSVI
jgi:hypothetical protein